MANILNSIKMSLMSLKDFESKALAYDVFFCDCRRWPSIFPHGL